MYMQPALTPPRFYELFRQWKGPDFGVDRFLLAVVSRAARSSCQR